MSVHFERAADIVRLLLKYPMTAEMILHASKNFRAPFTSYTRVKETLKYLNDEGYLNRQPLWTASVGQKPYLYFLKKRAKRFVPEVGDIGRANAAFRGLAETPMHTLYTSETMSHLERSAGEMKKKIRILASIRPRYFRATVMVRTHDGEETVSLIPDYTQVVEVDGVPNLFFFEIQNRAAVINPASPKSTARSFKFKLAKYKAFLKTMHGHHLIEHFRKTLHFRFPGFRVLVVTAKGEINRCNLLQAAKGYRTMAYIATLDDLKTTNFFSSPVWLLPNGSRRSIID